MTLTPPGNAGGTASASARAVATAVASATQSTFAQALAAATSSPCNACSTAGAAGAGAGTQQAATAAPEGSNRQPAPGANTFSTGPLPPPCAGATGRDCCSRGVDERQCRCQGGWCRFGRVSERVWRSDVSGEECSC